MSSQQQNQEIRLEKRLQDEIYDDNQQVQGLQKTRQKNSSLGDQTYVKKQNSKVKNDFEDFKDLEEEIQRLKKIKGQYKEQKQSIEQLSKVVQTLKSQNKSLKLEKQSNQQFFQQKDFMNQVERNHESNENNNIRRVSNPNRQSNKIKGNIVNRDIHKRVLNQQNVGIERFLSPQAHRRISSNSLRNIGHVDPKDNFLHEMAKMDQQTIVKNHQYNKKSVIATFVEQLKQQLEQNEMILQRQKRAHRQTREKLQVCLEQLAEVRLLFDKQRNFEVMERQNIQLKKQLQFQTEQRLITQQKLREKQILLSQYEAGYSTRCSQFDRELDKMDQIYFSIERTLKF